MMIDFGWELGVLGWAADLLLVAVCVTAFVWLVKWLRKNASLSSQTGRRKQS